MAISVAAVRDLARDLGHYNLLVRPTRRSRFVCECACGFISRSVLNQRFAAEEGILHLENSIRDAHRSGHYSKPGRDTPVEHPSEGRPSRIA